MTEQRISHSVYRNFLSIKNFRNGLIHSDFNAERLNILESGGITSDLTYLGEDMWEKFIYVQKNMLAYVNEYALRKLGVKEEFIKPLISMRTPQMKLGITLLSLITLEKRRKRMIKTY
ncbi:hypothetical protein [Paenibacillus gansuensis]|uniref:Aminoglycoside phosphotransferase domain-containing protein n=1 Tax=Paenibacillus gansuensis TaxID=306542 RepID=A0ABW5PA60_9BACL